MSQKNKYIKNIFTIVFAFCMLIVLPQAIFAGCDKSYFKTNYRNINTAGYNYIIRDWNGDGRPDLWKAEPNSTTNTLDIIIYFHNGNGDWNFDNPTVYKTDYSSAGFTPLSFQPQLLDFDSDGDMDFIAEPYLSVYRNNGDKTFTKLGTSNFPGEQVEGGLPYADLNGDKLLDRITVIGVPNQGRSIGYNPGKADGTFGSRVDLITGTGIHGAHKLSGDFTGDGKVDIAFRDSENGNFIKVLISKGDGTFTLGNQTPFNFNERFVTARDFNNDGKADILAAGFTFPGPIRYLSVYYSNGDGSFKKTELNLYHPNNFAENYVADFNGDNLPDIIEIDDGDRVNSGEPFYSIHLSNGTGGFTRTDYNRFLPTLSPNPNAPSIFFDHDGDNKADLLSGVFSNFGESVTLVKQNVCQPFGQTKMADFDGNGTADLVRWNPNTGDWTSTDGIFSGRSSSDPIKRFNWGIAGDVPALGDFDGDGKTDYSVYRNSTGTWYIFRSSDSSWLVTKFGVPGDVPVPKDYDGGGKTDIAVFRPSDGNWYVFYTETQQFSIVHFGTNGDKPVPEDYDGDGKTDIAVYRPSEGNWYYLKSSNQNFSVIHWGIASDTPLPADYDGDGKADIAVYRAGDWYILRSSNNKFNFIHWGNSGDFPMPFYKNGDIAELVVFRPINGLWYDYYYYFNISAIYFDDEQNIPVRFGLPE